MVFKRRMGADRDVNLLYITNTSLDGYIEDETGAFDWENSDRVHPYATALLQSVGTHLYGRRLYETMSYWDAPVESYPPEHREFARLWQAAEKIVFSRTLTGVSTRNTRLERDFDPEAVRRLKRESPHDIFIGGAELAGLALEANLVDECHLFIHPLILGGGKPAFRSGLRRSFDLLEAGGAGTGILHLHYRIKGATR